MEDVYLFFFPSELQFEHKINQNHIIIFFISTEDGWFVNSNTQKTDFHSSLDGGWVSEYTSSTFAVKLGQTQLLCFSLSLTWRDLRYIR